MTALDLVFWVAGFLSNVVLLFVLWKRHRAHRFPIFTTMIAFAICRTLALFFTHRYGSGRAYFYAYWTLAIVDVALQLLVLYEAASQVFCPGGHWAPGVRRIFLWMIAASAILAAGLAWLANPESETIKRAVVIRGNFFASVLISELFVGMIVLSVTTGLPWRTHVARIVQGLGVVAIVGILVEALQSSFGHFRGTDVYQFLSHIQIGTYMVTLTFWNITLAKDAPEPRALPEQLRRQLLHLNDRTALALDYLRLRGRA
ncbi:MAG TPA: hypothetical protein VFC39_20375 [Acidobacteriaceae bacterium]|nr:hypothetical protein [Acidobacteriaceae bacterium]